VWDPEQLDALLSTLHQRVNERRDAGEYPEGLEERFAEHFSQLTIAHSSTATELLGSLATARAALDGVEFGDQSSDDSRIPGGRTAHRLVSKAIARDLENVIEQTRRHAVAVDRVVGLLCEIVAALAASVDRTLVQQIGDLQVRSAEERAHLHALVAQLDDLAARVAEGPGPS
jgi:hypothetical protein